MAELTKADAARLVKRVIPEIKDGKATGKMLDKDVGADEVLSFRLGEGGQLVVVTTDGQKLCAALSTAQAAKAGK